MIEPAIFLLLVGLLFVSVYFFFRTPPNKKRVPLKPWWDGQDLSWINKKPYLESDNCHGCGLTRLDEYKYCYYCELLKTAITKDPLYQGIHFEYIKTGSVGHYARGHSVNLHSGYLKDCTLCNTFVEHKKTSPKCKLCGKPTRDSALCGECYQQTILWKPNKNKTCYYSHGHPRDCGCSTVRQLHQKLRANGYLPNEFLANESRLKEIDNLKKLTNYCADEIYKYSQHQSRLTDREVDLLQDGIKDAQSRLKELMRQ